MKLKQLASKVSDLFHLEAAAVIEEPGFNGRTDYGDLQALADDIAENGVIVPFIVRKPPGVDDHVFMLSGHRRRRAIDLLIKQGRWDKLIPCKADDRNSTPMDRLFTQLSENSGKPLTLLEKAHIYQRIRTEAEAQGQKITGSQIASRSQTTKQAVSNALTLIEKASPHLIELIEKDKISATTALEIIRISEDHAAQDTAADQALTTAASSGQSTASPKHLPKKEVRNQESGIEKEKSGGEIVYQDDEDEEEQEEEDYPTKNQEPRTDNSPSDPGAIDRIKNTPATSGSGFNTGGGGGGGNGTIETRLKNIEKCLESLEDSDYEINETRKETVELIINILNGDTTTATLKSHLRL